MANHWYSRVTGEPKYTIIGKNGKERDTTLADARKLDLVPSVTTINGLLAKPFLNKWIIDQVLLAVQTHKKLINHDNFDAIVLDESQKITKESSKRGTELHDILEQCYKDKSLDITNNKDLDFILPVFDEVNALGLDIDWIAEKSVVHSEGFGGKVDLHSRTGNGFIVDFKTKQSDDIKKFQVYDEHVLQLAAYRLALNLPHARCFNLFISTVTPGVIKLVEHSEEDLVRYLEMFRCMNRFWQLKNKFGISV